MKISDTRNTPAELVSHYTVNQNRGGAEAGKQATGGIVAEEKVSLSSTARDFQKIEKAIDELPDVREEKVQTLKAQIEAGTYEVNAEKIAEKMVSESLVDIVV